MSHSDDLGFEQTEPLALKGYVIDWDGTGHHVNLLKRRFVPYHWRDVRSFDSNHYEPKPSEDPRKMNNAKGAMNNMAKLSLAGGIAAIRADGHESLFVGRVNPGCLWTGNVQFEEGGPMTLKGFRFHSMAEVRRDESSLTSELAESLNEARGTLGKANDADALLIHRLIQKLDSERRIV